jgi:hypothetical protein
VVDVAMNAHGVTVERRLGRPVMSGFHAMYSLGGTAGAVLGALAAGAGLGRTHHFLLIVLAGIAVAVPATGMLLPSGADAAGVATFTAAMTAGRLAGDRVAARLGPVTAFRSGALLAGIGFGAALLVGTPLAGLAGLGLLGAACRSPSRWPSAPPGARTAPPPRRWRASPPSATWGRSSGPASSGPWPGRSGCPRPWPCRRCW